METDLENTSMRDLREYLWKLKAEGELINVTAEVDTHLEVGAITRRVCEQREPAPLFENLKGYPGHRMAGVLMGPGKHTIHSRIAIALGLDKMTPASELIRFMKEKIRAPVNPKLVDCSKSPCKEIILREDEANLYALPSPWIKEIDGGRYVGTWDIVVTKDPDSGWVNWGVYRCMVKDEKSFAILLFPGAQHGGSIFRKYEIRKQPMPVALVIGADPLCQLAAILPMAHGVSEAGAAGGLMGEAPPLVKCETIDLEVPASAELIIEAEIRPGEKTEEGPFGEYTGHTAHRGITPLARVKCITHRENPIFTMANMGKPWDDSAPALSLLQSVVATERLEAHGIYVRAVYYHAPATAVVVSVKPLPGLVKRIVSVLTSGHRVLVGPGIVIVDEDVNVTDLEDVWWAITTRMHPERFEVLRGVTANPLIPFLTPEERECRETSLWLMDATFPSGWTDEYRDAHTRVADFKNAWSEEIRRTVVERWNEYGFG
jgi:4-hydroxy-3-polyprenylbenzoate decarboxylase